MNQRLFLLPLLLILLAAGLVSCDSSNPVAPTGTVLTMSANPTQISLDETSIITITGFRPDGNALFPGTRINLTTDLGVIEPATVEADDNGRATAVLRPDGRPGPATITATLPGAGDSSSMLTVQIGEEGIRPSLAVTTSPSRINIEQESEISVIARNVDGSFLVGGRVRLRTSLGVLDEDTLTTDASGEARTVLRPDGRSGTATVTGSVDAGEEVTADVTIIQTQVIIQVSPRIVDVNAEGEQRESADVTVLLRDEDNLPLVDRHEVRLTAGLGTLDPETVVTQNGEGEATYFPGTRAGQDTIQAFFGNAQAGTATVDVRTAPAALTLTGSRTTLPPSNDTEVEFTATVTDAEGLLLSNEVINFSIVNPGVGATFDPGQSVSTDTSGRAVVRITFQETTLPPVGTVITVVAAARGGVQGAWDLTVQ